MILVQMGPRTASTPATTCDAAAGNATSGLGLGMGVPPTGGWLPAGSNAGSIRIRVPAISINNVAWRTRVRRIALRA
jgi:hypothetical protein